MKQDRIQKRRRQLGTSTGRLEPALPLHRRTILLRKPARCHAQIVVIGRHHLLQEMRLIRLSPEPPDRLALPYAIPYAIGMATQTEGRLTLFLCDDRLLRDRVDQAHADERGRHAHRDHDVRSKRAEREIVNLQMRTTQTHHFAIRKRYLEFAPCNEGTSLGWHSAENAFLLQLIAVVRVGARSTVRPLAANAESYQHRRQLGLAGIGCAPATSVDVAVGAGFAVRGGPASP